MFRRTAMRSMGLARGRGCRAFSEGMFGDGSGKAQRSPVEIYAYLTRKKMIHEDAYQRKVVDSLERLYKDVSKASPDTTSTPTPEREPLASFFGSLFGSKPSALSSAAAGAMAAVDPSLPKGLYLWGEPGCGKTFLMDLTFRCCPETFGPKRRTHFNSFMMDMHKRIFQIKAAQGSGGGDPIPRLVDDLVQESRVLFFDEFQVTDVADAMVLKRLFSLLFARGVVVVATSNRPPQDLYQNGIQRELFVPFIDMLAQQTQVIELKSGLDYRTMGTYLKDTYFSSATEQQALEDAYERTLDGTKPEPLEIEVEFGRTLMVPKASNGVARFTFEELCKNNLGATDYMGLVKSFHTVFITDVPLLGADLNVVNRFIKCVDELYQGRVRTVMSAAAPPLELFKGEGGFEEVFAFSRCSSRLMEMQSKEYIENSISNKIEV